MLQHPIPPSVLDEENETLDKWKHWLSIENNILRQKARIQWVMEGDENTTFFHASIKQKHTNSRITRLVLDDGTEVMDFDGIENEILRFYRGLLGSSS